MENRHVYRLPKDAEMKTLINQANAYSAYCYTDKGNKVYGAFFYTCKPEAKRIVGFPTGARRLYKYNDVTPLVRAQKGLLQANAMSGVPSLASETCHTQEPMRNI